MWTNADGLQVRFASDWADNSLRKNRPGTLRVAGARKQIEIDVDLKMLPAGGTNFSADLNNDGTKDGFYNGDDHLPAHASITDVFLVSGETAAGGTSIKVGLFQANGTAIDDDGLITATAGVTANMAIGERINGDGAFAAATAGTAGIGANPGFIGITTVGTFTAGKARLVIEYIDPVPTPAG